MSETRHETARTRRVTWEDPLPGAEVARRVSGLEFLQALAAGEVPIPPLAILLGFDFVEVAEGRAVFAFEPAEYHYNPIGVVHGGVASSILDTAMGCAVHSVLPAGVAYTTVDLNVTLVRPLTVSTGRVTCEGHTTHVGGRIATAEGKVVDAAGRLYAHGTCTCLVMRS
jgi:uncharacterized protein (TIGR00369 family)